MVGAGGYIKWLSGLAASSKVVSGATLGGSFYTAGQIYKGETLRLGELHVNMGTGAVAAPLASASVFKNALLGGAVNASNTGATNWLYGENNSITNAFGTGYLFSTLGVIGGKYLHNKISSFSPIYIGGNVPDPSLAAILQNPGRLNPYPGYAGAATENVISNIHVFMRVPKQGETQ